MMATDDPERRHFLAIICATDRLLMVIHQIQQRGESLPAEILEAARPVAYDIDVWKGIIHPIVTERSSLAAEHAPPYGGDQGR